MNDQIRWRRIEALYHRARELPPAERSAMLIADSAGDDELRREVESLLRQDASESGSIPDAGPGTRIGPYELLEAAGEGGMGRVFRARDSRLNRTVAIKLISPKYAAVAEFRQRFQREARAVSALAHENICRLYDIGEHEGNP